MTTAPSFFQHSILQDLFTKETFQNVLGENHCTYMNRDDLVSFLTTNQHISKETLVSKFHTTFEKSKSVMRPFIHDFVHMALNENYTNVDILVFLEHQDRDFKQWKIMSFMVVSFNTCSLYANNYTLEILCSTSNTLANSNIALYLLCCKQNTTNKQAVKMGLVQLYRHYLETQTFCLFSRYGFAIDQRMYEKQCLTLPDGLIKNQSSFNYNALQMSVNLDTLTSQQIEDIHDNTDNAVHSFHWMCKIPEYNETEEEDLIIDKYIFYLHRKRIAKLFLAYELLSNHHDPALTIQDYLINPYHEISQALHERMQYIPNFSIFYTILQINTLEKLDQVPKGYIHMLNDMVPLLREEDKITLNKHHHKKLWVEPQLKPTVANTQRRDLRTKK